MGKLADCTIMQQDDNTDELRRRFPGGLHFVVGDLHGETATLVKLMQKIRFNPDLDHVYFIGDYNGGGDVRTLLNYMSLYYQADYDAPGFHMIRGNHEREMSPRYALDNLPDIIVIKSEHLNFHLVHAGMVSDAFDLINKDIDLHPDQRIFAYRLEDNTCCYDAPLRQLVWSMRGLYSQHSRRHMWPAENKLIKHNACIIHGHTPYCFFTKGDIFTYGDDSLFWGNQHVCFCRELRSFDLDSNIKGRYENGETYRGLSCLCMEVYDEIAAGCNGLLTTEMLRDAKNGLFGVEIEYSTYVCTNESPDTILKAKPAMNTIGLDARGCPVIVE